ncbi:hypothetical protein COL82_09580 [Bacillus toyonensis]|uniref:NACHT domain-containing protein n=1 Tax=Bacillus toyonensis TaxID=155322 RepID=UPI000BF6848C|nr:NACHT domain-containing protein [Bacillus toyonensis]PFZ78744.1 hypothetical protein COL82_09580 [Bacillus toyonensis]
MKPEIRKAIPKLICGKEEATAFIVSENIAITATHAIMDYFESKVPIKLLFGTDNEETQEIEAEPILIKDGWEELSVIALKLNTKPKDISPLKCINYKFNTSLKCETFGYPPVRNTEGTFIDVYVKNEIFSESFKTLESEWNLDLKKDDDIKDFKGISGGPLLLEDFVVGVFLQQTQESGETSRLGAASLYLYKEYFKEIGINLIEKSNDLYYEAYLNTIQSQLEQQLENTILRKLNKNNGSFELGFTFKFTDENDVNSKLESYVNLLNLDDSAVILSEPGGGKTYLLAMLAKDIIENPVVKKNKIPIILKAKNWARSYHNIVDGIKYELKHSIPDIGSGKVEYDLSIGKYLILVDGLDEVTSSLDLLVEELIKISKVRGIQILVTCRKENYHKQFYSHFGEYTIEKLDDEQIIEYVEKELNKNGWQVLHNIEGNVKSLLQNPLFLFMTVSTLKNSKDRKLPKNKAELYANYIRFLMEARHYLKGLVKPFDIDITTKELILSDFAKRTFKDPLNGYAFMESVCLFLDRGKIEIVKKELLDTGLLIAENGDLSFFHPSFHEYFFALNISQATDDKLMSFTKKYNSKDSYYEVFIFLAGLLKGNNRQKIFLDYLEANNLYLYRRCLEAKFDSNSQIKEKWSQDFTQEYFEQVRCSYLQIIQTHFTSLKSYFHPWCSLEKWDQMEFDLVIEGSMDYSVPAINFCFLKAKKTSDEMPKVILRDFKGGPRMYTKGNEVSIPIKTLSAGNHWFLDLKSTDMGIDSAREVALYSIKEQLAEIFNKQKLFAIESPEMLVMQVEHNLRKLPLERFSVVGKDNYRKPSLYKYSVDELINLFMERDIIGYANSLNSYGYFNSEDVLRMVISLFRVKELNIDPKDYLLPASDIGWEELKKQSGFIWEMWSDQQLSKRISSFYEYYQLSYRYLVENYFSSLKEFLPFYAMGPIKFNIIFEREDSFGGGVEVSWEPVRDIENIKTSIKQEPYKENKNSFDLEKSIEEDKLISKSLFKLGRRSLPFFSRGSSALSMYIRDDDEMRNKVYSQLKEDFGYILGRLK